MADTVLRTSEPVSTTLIAASAAAAALPLQTASNGIRYTLFGELKTDRADMLRMIEAVPATIVPTLANRAFYFVPLALAAGRDNPEAETVISPVHTQALADEATCHRNVELVATDAAAAHTGTFISVRLLRDHFSVAFEFFINVAHSFAAVAGLPDAFATLAWQQATEKVRGETSQDAWESRTEALAEKEVNEKAKLAFLESAFADTLAIYMLSLALDFDYTELREREYPLLAAPALAARLRLAATLFPPNDSYEFSIRYRR